MNIKNLIGKGARTKVFAAATVVIIILVFLLNLALTYLGVQKSLYVDLTTEGLYTLTDTMKRECAFIDELDNDERKVKVTFCADPDTLMDSQITRVTYFMALQMQEEFDNFEVETVNINYNPTAVSKYKPSSLSTIEEGDIIISYGSRYRIQKPLSFWRGNSETLQSYDGEYRMATYIMSVTAVNRPAAYFVTGHGETYYDAADPARAENAEAAALYDLLTERGLEVKTVDLEAYGRVPEDCVLLIINNPTSDFKVDPDKLSDLSYSSEIEMLDKYLINNMGAIMVSRNHENTVNGVSSQPAFDAFLYEWGFDFSESVVADSENYIDREDGAHTTVIGEYDTNDQGYGYAIYGDFAALPSAADTVFNNAGYISSAYVEGDSYYETGTLTVERKFLSFMKSYDSAVAYEKNSHGEYADPEKDGALTLAATTARKYIDQKSGESSYSYVFCVNSPDFFSNELLYNSSYANYEVVSLLVENIARTDMYASIDLGSDSQNSSAYGGKILANTSLSTGDIYEDIYENGYVVEQIKITSGISFGDIIGFTVVIVVLPLILLGLGIAVFVRRRFL